MNHATPKAPINEQTHPASPHHREPKTGEGCRTRESSDRSLTSPAANALDWKICALGSSFDLDEVVAAAPATEILPGLDALVPPNPMASPKPIRRVDQPRSGLTLLELVVVLMILVALAGVIVPLVNGTSSQAMQQTTDTNLMRLRDVIMNRYWPDMNEVMNDGANPIPGYPYPSAADISGGRQNHPQLYFLFVQPDDVNAVRNPLTQRGWNGPYIQSNSGFYAVDAAEGFTSKFGIGDGAGGVTDDPTVLDAWGHPIVIQAPDVTNDGLDSTELQHARLISAGANGVIETPTNVLMPSALSRGDDLVMFLRVPDTASP